MRVGVMGAGAIGCYVGGRLAAAGEDVVLVGRASLAEAVARGGLHLTETDGVPVAVPPARLAVATDPAALAACDVVLVAVKSGDSDAAARSLAPHLAQGACLVSLQNGVRNPDTLRAVLPRHVVLAGMVPFNVARKGESGFHRGTSGAVLVERGANGEGERVAGALRRAGIEAAAHDDLPGVLWGKLVLNLNNSINALAGVPLREELGVRDYRRVLAACMGEALAVLRRADIAASPPIKLPLGLVPHVLRMPTPLFRVVARSMIRIDAEARSSMWEDLERRRPTEIEYLNGEVVRVAAELAIDAPVNARVATLVREAESAGRGSPRLDAATLARAVLGGDAPATPPARSPL